MSVELAEIEKERLAKLNQNKNKNNKKTEKEAMRDVFSDLNLITSSRVCSISYFWICKKLHFLPNLHLSFRSYLQIIILFFCVYSFSIIFHLYNY